MVHAADEGHPVDLLGEQGQMFADVVARDGRGNGPEGALDITAGSGFEVEGVDVAQSSPGEDHDAATGPAEALYTWSYGGSGGLGQGEVTGQAQAQRARAEEVATGWRTGNAWSGGSESAHGAFSAGGHGTHQHALEESHSMGRQISGKFEISRLNRWQLPRD